MKMKEKDFRKIRGNEVSIIFQDPMTSLNPVYTIGNQIVRGHRACTPKRAKQEALGTRRWSCWSWSASTSRKSA